MHKKAFTTILSIMIILCTTSSVFAATNEPVNFIPTSKQYVSGPNINTPINFCAGLGYAFFI